MMAEFYFSVETMDFPQQSRHLNPAWRVVESGEEGQQCE